ncbi:MAG: Gfo/Idh/MocA family oxidoreductase [Thermomicrobiales bacterium]|nr:Gfo/Idh/MocA family oxidoreductase [Chloroflexia bacterium]
MIGPCEPLTASVVGGGSGGRLSLKALTASDRFQLVAATDLRDDVLCGLQQDYPTLRTFTDYREMFAACPTDVVCVSTYPPSHEPITLDALELPLKGILVEKPLGHTAASGQRILNAIRQRGIPMAVPHGLLAKRTPLEIIERVQDGQIGELVLIEIQCTGWDIINAGIHWLDFALTALRNEPVESVLALCDSTTRTYRDGMQVETVAVTSVQMQSGVRVVMHTGDHLHVNRPGKATLFRLVGTAGVIEFWGWENGYRIVNACHPSGETIVPEEFPVIGHRRHLEHLADMIVSGDHDFSIPEGSLLALEVCEAAYLSSRHRCQVTFPLASFVPPPATAWEPGQPYAGAGGGRDGRML